MSGGASYIPPPAMPRAQLKPERRISWAWIFPVLALAFAAWIGWRAWALRGSAIYVQLEHGHGLEAGDDVRYRGINVGRIESVHLNADLKGVIVTARLTSQSDQLARSGTRFWVVRPQLRLTRVEGLETLIGPRYLAALPSDVPQEHSRRQRVFVGLGEPPVVDSIQPGDLEIILHAGERGSLHPGAPISYRQTRIGTILSVGLASDGGAVEARAHIQKPFVQLIRPQTRFWDVGGIEAKLGITGLTIDIESAEALIEGGVALATPPNADDVVRTGHRFTLAPEPDDEWLEWQPLVVIGSSMLPPGVPPPQPLRATIGWTQGRWISREKSRQGWVLQTAEGLLGPADLLVASEQAQRESVVLEVAGAVVPLDEPPVWQRHGMALVKANVAKSAWPAANVRRPAEVEECLVIADSASDPLPLAASRLSKHGDGGAWTIDSAVAIDPSWHGAAVVSRGDGKLIGLLLAGADEARVALLGD